MNMIASLTEQLPNPDALIANAIAWATAKLGETRYATFCLGFVEDAFERGNDIQLDGYATAKEAADGYGTYDDSGVPPRGALVFYDWWGKINSTDKNWGHVGISLGDGCVIHALAEVRIDVIRDVVALLPPNEANPPRYVGWVPVSASLIGVKPRKWD